MNIDHTLTWEAARAGGLLAYALVTASVVLGLLLSMRAHSPRWPRFLTNELHRHVTLLALLFAATHGMAVWIDPFTGFDPAEVLVPLAAHYRPIWLALGIVGGYMLAAVWLSEYARRFIGYRAWHAFHLITFGAFVLATLHGLGSGSDTPAGWALALYGGSLALVVGLLVVRVARSLSGIGRWSLNLGASLVAVAIVLFALMGPARGGWNAIANEGRGNGASAAWLALHAAPAAPAFFSTDIQVKLVENGLLAGSFNGTASGRVEVLLTEQTAALGLVLADGWTCEGPLSVVGDAAVTSRCFGADGSAVSVQLSDLRQVDEAVVGRMSVTPG